MSLSEQMNVYPITNKQLKFRLRSCKSYRVVAKYEFVGFDVKPFFSKVYKLRLIFRIAAHKLYKFEEKFKNIMEIVIIFCSNRYKSTKEPRD